MIISNAPVNSDDVAGHYNELDDYYRMVWGDHLHHGLWESGKESTPEAIENLIEYCHQALQVETGSRICDVGCGYGGTSRHMAEKHGLEVTGLTISERQFNYAVDKLQGASNPQFLLRNWEQNGLPNDSFDALVSIECIAHVVDKERYFSEVQRVMRPGARAAIVAWLADKDAGRIATRLLLEPICREGRLPSMGSPEDYHAMACAAGLRVVSYEDLTRRVRKTWAICLWRVACTLLFTRTGWRFLFSRKSKHFIFIFSVARILIAYYTGSMKYGLFVLEKQADA